MKLLMFITDFTTAGQETRSSANILLQVTCLFQLQLQSPLDTSVITKATEYGGNMFLRNVRIRLWQRQHDTFHSQANHSVKHGGNMVKVKVTLVQAMKLCTGRTAHRGSRCIALL